MPDLKTALRSYAEATVERVDVDDLALESVIVPGLERPSRWWRGWTIAVIAAVIVFAIAAAGFLLVGGAEDGRFVDEGTVPATTAPILMEAGSAVDAAAALIGDDWPYQGYPERLGDGTWVVFGNDWMEADDEVVWILDGPTGEWMPREVTEFGDVVQPFDRTYVHAGLVWALSRDWPSEVWNSPDGVTWRKVDWGDAPPSPEQLPSFAPWDYARAGDTILMRSLDDGILPLYVSLDAGRSFIAATPFPGSILHLWHTGDEFRAIVAVGVDALTLWRSGDGMEWEEIGPVRGLEDADLGWIPALSVSSEALLIGDLSHDCDGDVYRSVDGGSTWQALGIVEWLTDGFPAFLRPSCRSVASADDEWMLVTAGSAWGPPRAGVWGSRNGVDWYRLESSGFFYEGGSYPVVDTDLAPPLEP